MALVDHQSKDFVQEVKNLDAVVSDQLDGNRGLRQVISPATAPHYTWADICDGWPLLASPSLSVIQERMPPDTAETKHKHLRVRQFFYVLSGELTLEVEGVAQVLKTQEGLEVPPKLWHQARNEGGTTTEFLVISDGVAREDRQEIT